ARGGARSAGCLGGPAFGGPQERHRGNPTLGPGLSEGGMLGTLGKGAGATGIRKAHQAMAKQRRDSGPLAVGGGI
ncbi:unnamed protein product, partial [Cladocopium goreaui]